MAGFTKGPWRVWGFDICRKKTDSDGDHIVIGCVAKSYGNRSHTYSLVSKDAEAKANAHLIAASPDLFHVVELAKILTDDFSWGTDHFVDQECVELIEKIRPLSIAALAKARGEA